MQNRKTIELFRDNEMRIIADVDKKKERVILIKERVDAPVEFVGLDTKVLKSLISQIDNMEVTN